MTNNASIDDAVRLHQQGRLREAEQIYRCILRSEPCHSGALHLLGVICHQQGDHEAAVELIGRAVAAGPGKRCLLEQLRHAAAFAGPIRRGPGLFPPRLQIHPQCPQALANLGMAQQSLEHHEVAIASFRQALELEPSHADALFKLAALLEKLGRQQEAIPIYEEAIRHAACLEFYVNLGALWISTGRADMALGPLQKAIDLAPNCAAAHLNLGMAKAALGNDADALPSFRKAIDLQPRNPDILRRFAALLKKLGRGGEAVPLYERAMAESPTAETHFEFGELLFGLGKRDRAIEQYRRAIELAPELAEAHFNLGNALKAKAKSKRRRSTTGGPWNSSRTRR